MFYYLLCILEASTDNNKIYEEWYKTIFNKSVAVRQEAAAVGIISSKGREERIAGYPKIYLINVIPIIKIKRMRMQKRMKNS